MGEYNHEAHERELLTAARRIRRLVNAERPGAMSVRLMELQNRETGQRVYLLADIAGPGDKGSRGWFGVTTDDHEWAVIDLMSPDEAFAWSGMREPSVAAYDDEDAWMREDGESPERVVEWLLAVTEPGAMEAWCPSDEGEPAEWEGRLLAASPALHRILLENRARLHAELAAARSEDEGAREGLLRRGIMPIGPSPAPEIRL